VLLLGRLTNCQHHATGPDAIVQCVAMVIDPLMAVARGNGCLNL
jgi:hypothetical protein